MCFIFMNALQIYIDLNKKCVHHIYIHFLVNFTIFGEREREKESHICSYFYRTFELLHL